MRTYSTPTFGPSKFDKEKPDFFIRRPLEPLF